jgi:hypothetical protein
MNQKVIYYMDRNYRTLVVWECGKFRSRVCTHKWSCNTGLTREERYKHLAKALYSNFKVPAPAYQEKNTRQ